MNFTEREMLIAKIGLLQGAVLFGKINRLIATKILFKSAQEHGFTKNEALKLEGLIDQMFGDFDFYMKTPGKYRERKCEQCGHYFDGLTGINIHKSMSRCGRIQKGTATEYDIIQAKKYPNRWGPVK